MKQQVRKNFIPRLLGSFLTLTASGLALADHNTEEFGAAVVIIELTDNDIELQVFADAFDWTRVKILDPGNRMFFDTRGRGRLKHQGGMSELVWASEPSHFLNDEEDYDEEVVDFLQRWPEGEYKFVGRRVGRLGRLESEAYLSHALAALPEITAPEEEEEVCANQPLFIEWDPVTEPYTGGDGEGDEVVPADEDIEVIEYQVIVAQETPEREQSWIDGDSRSTLMNLPGNIFSVEMPAEVLVPEATYEIEVLAIERRGNASIGVLEFSTKPASECI